MGAFGSFMDAYELIIVVIVFQHNRTSTTPLFRCVLIKQQSKLLSFSGFLGHELLNFLIRISSNVDNFLFHFIKIVFEIYFDTVILFDNIVGLKF